MTTPINSACTDRNQRIEHAIASIRALITEGQPSVEQMQWLNVGILQLLKEILGPRSSAVLMVGMPIEGSEHDRFAALYFGPCLSARGLLAWGESSVGKLIDAGDTSSNGKPHP